MVTRSCRTRSGRAGFTLLEMLLVVAILIALLGAIVYNFESARRGADLEEGARQFEALVRFAQAQAANTGHLIQFRFGDDVGSSSSTNSAAAFDDNAPVLRVVWEPDSVAEPGTFVDMLEARPFIEALGDRVRISNVRLPTVLINQSTNDLAVASQGSTNAAVVAFFPDGSSQSADVILVSKDVDDFRQVTVKIDGVTGSLQSEFGVQDEFIPLESLGDTNSVQQVTGGEKTPTPAVENSTTPMPEEKVGAAVEDEFAKEEKAFKDALKPSRDSKGTNDFDADLP